MLKISIFLSLLCIIVPMQVNGAEFLLTGEQANFNVGDEFLVTVLVDTQGELINAFQGEIAFPEDLLRLKGIREKGSIVNLWITEPPFFSGLTPGGFVGEGVLFSLIFETKAQGEGVVAVDQGQALLNDGEGTSAPLEISNFAFLISSDISRPQLQVSGFQDIDPPEPFELRIGQAANVFDGRHFLVFAAKDKNTGIDYYEISIVRATETTAWEKVTSPFLLKQYDEIENIQVKAVDRSGNVRIAALSVQNSSFVFLSLQNIVILMGIGGVLIYLYWRKKRTP